MVLAAACAVALPACAERDPPDRATSTGEIRRAVTNFNRNAFQGEGDAACRFAAAHAYPRIEDEALAETVHDCASYWSWAGPADRRVQEMVAAPRIDRVRIRDRRAAARLESGTEVDLLWQDGRWKVVVRPDLALRP